MRPLREPAKQSQTVRFLNARIQKDARFANLVNSIRHIAMETSVTPSALRGAATLVADEITRAVYAQRQATFDDNDGVC